LFSVRDLATPLSVRSSLCTGPVNTVNPSWIEEQRMLAPTIVVGTPAKVSELFAEGRGLSGEQVRYLVIDEVDQLIARNLYEHVVSFSRMTVRCRLKR
jgi:translation initiation factor 4A